MIDFDESRAMAQLRARSNVVRTTARTLVAGFTAIGIYTGVYTMYNEFRESRFFSRADHVIEETQQTLGTARSLLDTLRMQPQQNLQSVNSCGVQQQDNRGNYYATRDNCALTVTIPYGGSISAAALTYFNDMHRWKADWDSNTHIPDAWTVQPGETYTFTLR